MLARWAAASMPRANPDTMPNPASLRHLQPARIIGFADRDERSAELARGFEFPLGLVTGIDLWSGTAAAAAREPRQRVECGARAVEMINQSAERARADILAADEPQPVDPLLVR